MEKVHILTFNYGLSSFFNHQHQNRSLFNPHLLK
uniref:Uncharacterized protein n=1 Tax=Arundo donax TaxID=35708 RepID=A0A0A9F724_ARUDO